MCLCLLCIRDTRQHRRETSQKARKSFRTRTIHGPRTRSIRRDTGTINNADLGIWNRGKLPRDRDRMGYGAHGVYDFVGGAFHGDVADSLLGNGRYGAVDDDYGCAYRDRGVWVCDLGLDRVRVRHHRSHSLPP
jgi:hypothetical protein